MTGLSLQSLRRTLSRSVRRRRRPAEAPPVARQPPMATVRMPLRSNAPASLQIAPPPPSYNDDATPDAGHLEHILPPHYDSPLPGYEEAVRGPGLASYEDLTSALRETLFGEMSELYAKKGQELGSEFQQPLPSRTDLSAARYQSRRWQDMHRQRAERLARRYGLLREYSEAVDHLRAKIGRERTLLAANPQLKAELIERFNNLTELYNRFESLYRLQERS